MGKYAKLVDEAWEQAGWAFDAGVALHRDKAMAAFRDARRVANKAFHERAKLARELKPRKR